MKQGHSPVQAGAHVMCHHLIDRARHTGKRGSNPLAPTTSLQSLPPIVLNSDFVP